MALEQPDYVSRLIPCMFKISPSISMPYPGVDNLFPEGYREDQRRGTELVYDSTWLWIMGWNVPAGEKIWIRDITITPNVPFEFQWRLRLKRASTIALDLRCSGNFSYNTLNNADWKFGGSGSATSLELYHEMNIAIPFTFIVNNLWSDRYPTPPDLEN